MIEVDKMNNQKIFINADLVVTIETTPDTVVTFSNGDKMLLKTKALDIIERIVAFRKRYSLPEVK